MSCNLTSKQYLGEKEISALCWASSDGSIVAVGYVDGDILFWNTSSVSSLKNQQDSPPSSNVVRLQLSSAERRLPVVILQWSPLKKSRNSNNGLLFIYGGDQIGSDELLTVRSWIIIHFIPFTELALEFGFCYIRIILDFSLLFRNCKRRWQLTSQFSQDYMFGVVLISHCIEKFLSYTGFTFSHSETIILR